MLTHDDRALVMDCGSGTVADAFADLGVKGIDWILFTHHHRDQCFGAGRLPDGERCSREGFDFEITSIQGRPSPTRASSARSTGARPVFG